MGGKRLRWSGTNVSSFSDGRACLVVQFLDQEGNLLEWVPQWVHVQALFQRATNTEVVNKPNSEWVAAFAKTANEVFQTLDPLKEAHKISGTLTRIRDSNLVFSVHGDGDWDYEDEEFPPAFQITEEFLEEWLGEYVTALVVNGYAVKVWRDIGRGIKIQHPRASQETVIFE